MAAIAPMGSSHPSPTHPHPPHQSELWSLDTDSLSSLSPIHGLLFLFQWKADTTQSAATSAPSDAPPPNSPLFIKQRVANACGTLACLHILLNSTDPTVVQGPVLHQWRAFARELGDDPDLLGDALDGSTDIRRAHNSFSRPEPFAVELAKKASDDDESYHFVAYIPHAGGVWELDGLKPAPKCLATPADLATTGEQWLDVASARIQARIAEGNGEVRFNLLASCVWWWVRGAHTHALERIRTHSHPSPPPQAMTDDKLATAKDAAAKAYASLTAAHAVLASTGREGWDAPAEVLRQLPLVTAEAVGEAPPAPAPTPETAEGAYGAARTALAAASSTIADEVEKREGWAVENVRVGRGCALGCVVHPSPRSPPSPGAATAQLCAPGHVPRPGARQGGARGAARTAGQGEGARGHAAGSGACGERAVVVKEDR